MRFLVTTSIVSSVLFFCLYSHTAPAFTHHKNLDSAAIASFCPRKRNAFKSFKFARIDHKKRLAVKNSV